MSNEMFDFSEVRELAVDFSRLGSAYADLAEMHVNDAGGRIRDDWRKDAQSSKHFKQIAPKITRTTSRKGPNSESEVGIERGGAGRLSAVWLFGGANGGGGTGKDPQTYIDAEGPRLADSLGDLVERLAGK